MISRKDILSLARFLRLQARYLNEAGETDLSCALERRSQALRSGSWLFSPEPARVRVRAR